MLLQHLPEWCNTIRHLLVWGASVRSNFPEFPTPGGFQCYFKLFIIWRRAADTDPWGPRPLFVPHPGCRARNSSASSLAWVWGLQPWEWGGEFPVMRTSRAITDEWLAKPGLIPQHFHHLKFEQLVQVSCLGCLWDHCLRVFSSFDRHFSITLGKNKLKILKLQKVISCTFRIQLLGISLILLRSLYQTTLKMPSIWAGIRSLRPYQPLTTLSELLFSSLKKQEVP